MIDSIVLLAAALQVEAPSAESFIADGSWSVITQQVKPGDRVILRFPPSPAIKKLEGHIQYLGGVVKVELMP